MFLLNGFILIVEAAKSSFELLQNILLMKSKAVNAGKKRNFNVLFGMLVSLFINILAYGQSGFPYAYGDQVIYYPKLSAKTQNIESIKAGLSQSLKRVGQVYDVATQKTIDAKDIKNISVWDDRIEIEIKSKKNNYFNP
jgi:hypothetical protein